MLYAHSKYSESNSAWILLVDTWRGESYWLSPSLAHFFLAISWRRQVLLYAHSKCLGNCSMRIQNTAGAALFYHIGAQSNTVGLSDIIELLTPYFECALSRLGYTLCSSKGIQNKNDNFEWFWSLSIRTLQTRYKLKRQLKKRFNIRRHMSTPRAFECYYFKIILNWCHSPFKHSVVYSFY